MPEEASEDEPESRGVVVFKTGKEWSAKEVELFLISIEDFDAAFRVLSANRLESRYSFREEFARARGYPDEPEAFTYLYYWPELLWPFFESSRRRYDRRQRHEGAGREVRVHSISMASPGHVALSVAASSVDLLVKLVALLDGSRERKATLDSLEIIRLVNELAGEGLDQQKLLEFTSDHRIHALFAARARHIAELRRDGKITQVGRIDLLA